MDIAEIRDRAQGVAEGGVSPDEVAYARSILQAGHGNIGAALYVVGLCGNSCDARLIENYLEAPHQAMFGELALKALVRYLGLVDQYRPLVRSLILTPDDAWEDGQMAAVFLAPSYFDNFQDDEVGCKLLDLFCDPASLIPSAAREALVEVLDIRDELRDPYGMDVEFFDVDKSYIVEVAMKRFNCTRTVN